MTVLLSFLLPQLTWSKAVLRDFLGHGSIEGLVQRICGLWTWKIHNLIWFNLSSIELGIDVAARGKHTAF